MVKNQIMKIDELFDKSIKPLIEDKKEILFNIIKEKIIPGSKNIIANDELCQNIFEKIYEIFPTTLRLVIKRESFIEYCFKNRDKIISLIENKMVDKKNNIELNQDGADINSADVNKIEKSSS